MPNSPALSKRPSIVKRRSGRCGNTVMCFFFGLLDSPKAAHLGFRPLSVLHVGHQHKQDQSSRPAKLSRPRLRKTMFASYSDAVVKQKEREWTDNLGKCCFLGAGSMECVGTLNSCNALTRVGGATLSNTFSRSREGK